MEAKELKIGNFIATKECGCSEVCWIGGNWVGLQDGDDWHEEGIHPIPLTEDWLRKFGFTAIENSTYINGRQWMLQVSSDYIDEELDEVVNRDGTWFDGIGSHSYREDGAMGVCALCRGNYICNNIRTVHQLQNLYFALTGEELTLKED
jgi:hypothetical protein